MVDLIAYCFKTDHTNTYQYCIFKTNNNSTFSSNIIFILKLFYCIIKQHSTIIVLNYYHFWKLFILFYIWQKLKLLV